MAGVSPLDVKVRVFACTVVFIRSSLNSLYIGLYIGSEKIF